MTWVNTVLDWESDVKDVKKNRFWKQRESIGQGIISTLSVPVSLLLV